MSANIEAITSGETCRIRAARTLLGRIGWGTIIAAGLLAGTALHSPQLGGKVALEVAHSLLLISPFLIGSFAIAGYTKAASVDALIVRCSRDDTR
jgi:hypothetical protein